MKPRTIGLLLCLLALAILGACTDNGEGGVCDPNRPKWETWHDPTYPDAQQVQTNQENKYRATTTFQTSATPKEVLAFYREELTKAGWHSSAQPPATPDSLDFEAANCCYWGEVRVSTATSSTQTNVTVKHSWSQGCY